MKRLVIYLHGKGGSISEAEHFKPLFHDCDVVGTDYISETPWDAKQELSGWYDIHSKGYDEVFLIANSIGAFFAMNALGDKNISKAMFISPIVNMEKLISDMMTRAGVTETELMEKQEISAGFGEVLSWKYLCYVREHKISWNIPTSILYAENDHLTSFSTLSEFAGKINASVTVMKNGEHWFHTDEQMHFLDNWITGSTAQSTSDDFARH